MYIQIGVLYLTLDQIDFMNRIKEVLEAKEITQMWLSQKLNKSYNMVNSYVQNRRQPSIEVLFQIAELLDEDVKDLLVSNKKKLYAK